MPKIFISYRRADSAETVNRLYDRLVYAFGRDNVFKDVDTLQRGDDFPDVLRHWVQTCDVVLSVIGQRWLTVQDDAGRRRLDNPNDWVRQENEMALARGKSCVLIPTIVDGAAFPSPAYLPESLSPLANRNSQTLSVEHFHEDVSALITFLRQHFKLVPPPPTINVDSAFRDLAEMVRIGDTEAARDILAALREQGNLPPRIRLDKIEQVLYNKVQEKERKLAYESIQPLAHLAENGLLPEEEVIAALEAFWRDYPDPPKDDPAHYERFRPVPVVVESRAFQSRFAANDSTSLASIPSSFPRLVKSPVGILVSGLIIALSLFLLSRVVQPDSNALIPTLTSAVLLATDTPPTTPTEPIASSTSTLTPTVATATPSATDTPQPTPTVPTATSTSTDTPQPILTATQSIMLRNADWTPVEQDFNGVTMVQVPAGCFTMRSEQGNDDEKPVTEICFQNSFWIDKTEVTNAQFEQFDGVAARASNWIDANRPRETITWFEAHDFCTLRGGRLPTEAEWEYAARGPDNLVYPWGNAFVAANVVYNENSNKQTAGVGSKPSGASWVGALDLSGNVWEWVSTLYKPYPYPNPGSDEERGSWLASANTTGFRTLRGGSWNLRADSVRAADRFGYSPVDSYSNIGFRCLVSAPMS